MTLFGIVASFLSTFWTFGFVRLGRKLRAYVDAGPAPAPQRIKKSDVLARFERGVWINVMGMGATLLGLQVWPSVNTDPTIWFPVSSES